ncbi:hypothetical protein E2320_016755, partial [Naja naja]
WGGELSTQQKVHAKELHQILKQQSKTGGISLCDIEDLITEIGYQCPWYPEKGSLDLADWIKIGVHLHSESRAPIQHLLLWQTCKEAVETVGFHSLKAPASLLPQEASAPPPYVQLTLSASTSMLPETSRTPPKISSKGSSAIQAGFKEVQEKGELTSEELTEGLNAFPAQEQVDAQGQIQYEWTPLPYTVLRELRKSISETGLRSTFTQGILEGISNAYHLIPQDWKDMMRCFLPQPICGMGFRISEVCNSGRKQLWGGGISQTICMGQGLLALYNNKLQAFLQLPILLLAVVFYMPLKNPYVGLPTHTLSPLFKALKNHDNPVDLITLTSDQMQVLQLINDALKKVWVDRCVENIPLTLVLIPTAKQPTAVLTQELTTAGKSSMNILEWIYLSHSPGHTISSPDTMYSELILKAREHSLVLLGLDIVNIILPIPLKDWERMLHLSSSLH